MLLKSTLTTVVLGASLLSLVSCGDKSSGKKSSIERNQQRQETQGLYRANLTALNASVAGTPSGVVTFKIEGDEVTATIDMDGAPAQVVHMQSIRIGKGCPEVSADINADGFIDIMETEAISGKVFIPLDSDINAQASGANYPVAHLNGKYHYNEAASLTSMIADIFAPDENAEDSIVNLEPGQELNFSGRTVLIQGVAKTNTLPETVATRDGQIVHTSLPIACGVLSRVENTDPVIVGNGGKE
jgi:hypothetical protein